MKALSYKNISLPVLGMVVVGLLAGCDPSGKDSPTTQSTQTVQTERSIRDEMLVQRASETAIWAMPAVSV